MFDDVLAYLAIVFNYAVEGAVAGLVAIVVYIITKHDESKNFKYNLARMLSVELESINILMAGSRMNRAVARATYDVLDMPRETYDGLVSSGNIAHFDRKLQTVFQKFYAWERQRQYDRMESEIVHILDATKRFQDKNKTWYRRVHNAVGHFGGKLSR